MTPPQPRRSSSIPTNSSTNNPAIIRSRKAAPPGKLTTATRPNLNTSVAIEQFSCRIAHQSAKIARINARLHNVVTPRNIPTVAFTQLLQTRVVRAIPSHPKTKPDSPELSSGSTTGTHIPRTHPGAPSHKFPNAPQSALKNKVFRALFALNGPGTAEIYKCTDH